MTICIPEKIKEFRARNGLSQSRFGELLGVTPQAVCKWENRICFPDIVLLPELARLLNCKIDDFFD
ncbi:MAG: helix-turn-helix transcriptional regulator [Clostridia bacterium]|nr:helix-turn-helix transcriptional regulator [Clostridia bacterium]MBQ9848873.1 helix-turn-helix transcriptional regulator [Clostridia bacterium]